MTLHVAFYEIIEIICAVIGLCMESYAFFCDSRWNYWLYKFGESMSKMCVSLNERTLPVTPVLNSTGFYGGSESGKIHMSMFYRNSSGEVWFLFSEVLAIVCTVTHLVYSRRSKRIGKIAVYGAYIHLLVFSCLVPASLLLVTHAYRVENSYKKLAAYHPQCINIIFCKEEDPLQVEIDESKSEDIQEGLRDLYICQQFWLKLISALFGAVHCIIAVLLVFVSMSVASRYDGNSYKDPSEEETPAHFYKAVTHCPSDARCQSSASLAAGSKSTNAILKFAKSSTTFAERFWSRKDYDDGETAKDEDDSIADVLMARRLSPQSMYREYKFRKQRIAEMERDQNFAQDPRVLQPGWDYEDVDKEFIKNVTDTGPESKSNYPKRVIRKPKVVNYIQEAINEKAEAKVEIIQPDQKITNITQAPAQGKSKSKKVKVKPI